jgi:hypothetical protein
MRADLKGRGMALGSSSGASSSVTTLSLLRLLSN